MKFVQLYHINDWALSNTVSCQINSFSVFNFFKNTCIISKVRYWFYIRHIRILLKDRIPFRRSCCSIFACIFAAYPCVLPGRGFPGVLQLFVLHSSRGFYLYIRFASVTSVWRCIPCYHSYSTVAGGLLSATPCFMSPTCPAPWEPSALFRDRT